MHSFKHLEKSGNRYLVREKVMAKFSIVFSMGDATKLDDVSAIFPDELVPAMIAAATALNNTDADGELITGPRAVTYAVRKFLTNMTVGYGKEAVLAAAVAQAESQFNNLTSAIKIEESV